MGYKLQKIFKDNKINFIVFIVMWLLVDILIIAPLSVGITESTLSNGKVDSNIFLGNFITELTSFKSFSKIFRVPTISVFGKATFWMTFLSLIVLIISIIKSKPKNDFTDIEHGSSDWSEGGEQYKILHKKKGIVLAENNYLPVNKVGNVNVMVIGRIRFW